MSQITLADGVIARRPAHRPRPRIPHELTTTTLGVVVLATGNLTMVAIMAVVPVQLHAHGHGLGLLGLVVSLHIGAMYAASPILGRIADRAGARRLAVAGAVMLVVAGLLPLAVGTGILGATTMMVLLGVGWNTQVVAGSALVSQDVAAADRPSREARGELSMSLAAGGGALVLAAPLVAIGGVELLAAATVLLNLPLVVLLHRGARDRAGNSSFRRASPVPAARWSRRPR